MIEVEEVLVSSEVLEKSFVCDLSKCKGACCIEGDLGAPLEEEELVKMKEVYPIVKEYMDEIGIQEVEKQGVYIKDWEDDYSTPTVDDKECVYAIYDEEGILKCAIEQAYNDGKIAFKKPISCHLYPIRISKLRTGGEALNYDKWSICSDACTLGEKLQVRVYQFLKDPLIRRYGKEWYEELDQLVQNEKSSD